MTIGGTANLHDCEVIVHIVRLLPATAVGVALFACEPVLEPIPDELQPNFMMGAPVVESVTGNAHFYWTHPSRPVEGWRTTSFNALRKSDGTVTGRWQLNTRNLSASWGSVVCFSVKGNEAWIAATTERSISPGLVGQLRVFRVIDSGEGSNAPPDRISDIPRLTTLSEAQEFCDEMPDWPERVWEIEAGNIQIHP